MLNNLLSAVEILIVEGFLSLKGKGGGQETSLVNDDEP